MGNRKTHKMRRGGLLACLLFTVSLLAGCATDYRRNGDPLTGAPPAPPPLPTPAAAALGKPAAPPPPPIGGTTAGSTAALASGARPGVNSGLRIGEAPTPNAVPTRQPTATLTGATLPNAQVPITPARALSYEQAQALLTTRGVKWQWLEMKSDTGEWRFMCRLPNRTNPNLNRTYEAKGPTHLAAVQAVLDQMDREGAGN